MGEEEETSQHLTSPASFFFLPSIFASLFLHRGARISERVPKSAAVEGVVAAQQHEPTLPPLSSWNRALRRTRKQGTPDRATTVRAAAPAHCGMCSLHMPVSRERERKKSKEFGSDHAYTTPAGEICQRGGRENGPDAGPRPSGLARPAVHAVHAPNFHSCTSHPFPSMSAACIDVVKPTCTCLQTPPPISSPTPPHVGFMQLGHRLKKLPTPSVGDSLKDLLLYLCMFCSQLK